MPPKKIVKFEQDSPGRKLSILHRLSSVYLAGPLSELGIARGSLPFLMKILRCEGIIQEDLTRSLCIDRAATARALQNLEKEGLVSREEDPQDRRKKRVYPAAKIKDLQENIIDILQAHNEALFAGFDEEEQLQLLDMLDRMTSNMHTKLHGKYGPKGK